MTDRNREEERKHSKQVDIGARKIGANTEWEQSPRDEIIPLKCCKDCIFLNYTETQYGQKFVSCNELSVKLNGIDPVIKCTSYKKRGEMELWEMKDIAIYIDDREKKRVGF